MNADRRGVGGFTIQLTTIAQLNYELRHTNATGRVTCLTIGTLSYDKLSNMAFKRVLKAKTAFKKHSAKLSPEVQKEWEDKYTEQGLFQLREQTAHCKYVACFPIYLSLRLIFSYFTIAQIGSLHRLVILPSHGKNRS